MNDDLSVCIGGDAGQGVESGGAGFCQAIARAGLHVFATQDYRSRIRGGHNFYQIRAAGRPLHAQRDPFDVLLALSADGIAAHKTRLAPGAAILYDESFGVDPEELGAAGLRPMPVPFLTIAADHGGKVMMNTAGLGALASAIGLPLEPLESVIRDNFAGKGAKVVDANVAVARDGYRYVVEHGDLPYRLPQGDGNQRMLINGNDAFSLGALAGGCRFVSAYPMTPATSIVEYLSGIAAEYGIVTKHAEDEIAAVCMAIGANYVGVRGMTATSGGGFSLMAEALGLAGMTEVPLVIVNVQRGGPSTGLPTRTEQSDLLFVLHASQGEFPRIVLAPGTIEECFEAGWRAFNLAERYQCPVIALSDQYLGASLRTVEPAAFDFASVKVDRGALLSAADLDRLGDGYRRFAFTDTGISPRGLPGHPNAVYGSSTDEHEEDGHITEEAHPRALMMRKRMRKERTALREDMRPPKRYGPERPEATLLSWGSTYGLARDAADILNATGHRVAVLHFCDLWPFPAEQVAAALDGAGALIDVEQNNTGQFAKLLRMTTGRDVKGRVLKYDGRPLSPQEVVWGARLVMAGEREVHIVTGEMPEPIRTEVKSHA